MSIRGPEGVSLHSMGLRASRIVAGLPKDWREKMTMEEMTKLPGLRLAPIFEDLVRPELRNLQYDDGDRVIGVEDAERELSGHNCICINDGVPVIITEDRPDGKEGHGALILSIPNDETGTMWHNKVRKWAEHGIVGYETLSPETWPDKELEESLAPYDNGRRPLDRMEEALVQAMRAEFKKRKEVS